MPAPTQSAGAILRVAAALEPGRHAGGGPNDGGRATAALLTRLVRLPDGYAHTIAPAPPW